MARISQENIKDKYRELIQYISQLGHKTKIGINNQIELTIDVYSYFNEHILTVKLFQPLDRKHEYNFHHLRISWAIPPNDYLGHCRWYHETNNQSVIFNTLLYDLIDYKLKNIGKETVDTSNTLIYEILKDWLKDKENSFNEETAKSNQSIWDKVKNIFKH